MGLYVFLFLLVFFLLLFLVLLWRLDWLHVRPSSSRGGAKRSTLQRLLKPRCPGDCPACRLASTASSGGGPASAPVRPCCEVKSRRGAPKRVNTEGFACPNPQCPYAGITDAQIHALVGDGKHGSAERIQTFRCQACHITFTARRNTPLYRLKTPSHHIAVVLSALAEGLDPSAAERVAGLSTSHYYHLAIPCWRARAHPARALLLSSPTPAPPAGRAAHQAPLRQAGAVALAGHRPLYKASSCAPSGSPHTKRSAYSHPLPATDPGSRLSTALHQ
jgi:transposase-like protein